jgi:hypothetical protein
MPLLLRIDSLTIAFPVIAHQVIDMLRDKLHLLSAQLVEARERVAELEAIREAKIERVGEYLISLVSHSRLIVSFQRRKWRSSPTG